MEQKLEDIRNCFGTREVSDKSYICKLCKHYKDCKEVKPKNANRQASI